MRDLVEFVIDGILQQERMQQGKVQQAHKNNAQRQLTQSNQGEIQPSRFAQVIDHARLKALTPSDEVSPQATDKPKERDAELWKVSLQFESIFVQQMMSEMRKTVNKSEFMPSGFAEDIHASMMDEAIAKANSRRSNFGIADNIYRQLEAAKVQSQPADDAGNKVDISKQNKASELSSAIKQSLVMQAVSKHAY